MGMSAWRTEQLCWATMDYREMIPSIDTSMVRYASPETRNRHCQRLLLTRTLAGVSITLNREAPYSRRCKHPGRPRLWITHGLLQQARTEQRVMPS